MKDTCLLPPVLRMTGICKIYGATCALDDVTFELLPGDAPLTVGNFVKKAKAKAFEKDPKYDEYATMMVKTQLSLTHDPTLKGVPKGWTLPIRDVLVYSGAKFLCPVAGTISLMPGTASDPAFRRIDVDTATGKVRGLF